MQREIAFLEEYRSDVDKNALRYHAKVGDDLVMCRIAVEALHDGWPEDQEQPKEKIFEKHRSKIEQVTRELIKAGRLEPDGSIGIRSSDVMHRSW